MVAAVNYTTRVGAARTVDEPQIQLPANGAVAEPAS